MKKINVCHNIEEYIYLREKAFFGIKEIVFDKSFKKEKMVKILLKEIEENNDDLSSNMMLALGDMYSKDFKILYDEKKSLFWYKKAAKKGNLRAKSSLLMKTLMANNNKEKSVKAFNKLKAIANKDTPYIYCNIGYCYSFGYGVEKDLVKAYEYYELSSSYRVALFNMGLFLFQGNGVEVDRKRGLKLMDKAAKDGYAYACLYLGQKYEKGAGVNRDAMKAYYYYKLGARLGNGECMCNIGHLAFKDEIPYSPDKTYYWFRRSAHAGYPKGQHLYGLLLIWGVGGDKHINRKKGEYWLKQAEKNGYVDPDKNKK